MSRIGKLPVKIPSGVTLKKENNTVIVTGPKGTLKIDLRPEIDVTIDGAIAQVSHKIETKKTGAYAGLTRALLNNMVLGVTSGFEKSLELIGVGFRAKQEGPSKISMTLGFSHPVVFEAPEGIELQVLDNTKITVKGFDKGLVGLTAANIRKVRKPEPYKGKGIKYAGEVVRRKAGKSGKTAK